MSLGASVVGFTVRLHLSVRLIAGDAARAVGKRALVRHDDRRWRERPGVEKPSLAVDAPAPAKQFAAALAYFFTASCFSRSRTTVRRHPAPAAVQPCAGGPALTDLVDQRRPKQQRTVPLCAALLRKFRPIRLVKIAAKHM
jgi:hypothetical protein